MVEEAEKESRLVPGKSIVIEPTSKYQLSAPPTIADSQVEILVWQR